MHSPASDILYQSFFVPPDVILLLLSFHSSGTGKWNGETWSFHPGNNKKFWWYCVQTLWKKSEIRDGHLSGITENINFSPLPLCNRNVNIFITLFSQEELKIVNLVYALLLDEELDTREAGLHNFLMKKEKEKVSYHLECCSWETCNIYNIIFFVKNALSKSKFCHKWFSDNLQGHWFFFKLYIIHMFICFWIIES